MANRGSGVVVAPLWRSSRDASAEILDAAAFTGSGAGEAEGQFCGVDRGVSGHLRAACRGSAAGEPQAAGRQWRR